MKTKNGISKLTAGLTALLFSAASPRADAVQCSPALDCETETLVRLVMAHPSTVKSANGETSVYRLEYGPVSDKGIDVNRELRDLIIYTDNAPLGPSPEDELEIFKTMGAEGRRRAVSQFRDQGLNGMRAADSRDYFSWSGARFSGGDRLAAEEDGVLSKVQKFYRDIVRAYVTYLQINPGNKPKK